MRKKRALAALLLALCLLPLGAPALAGSFDEESSILLLVNKEQKVSAKYKPELVKPAVPTNKKDQAEYIYMRPEAAKALEEMFAAAKDAGHTLLAVSGYRSYQTQKGNYDRKVKSSSAGKGQTTVAPPGASEHQLGLAMDVGRRKNTNLSKSFGDSPEGQWVAENAHRFGFIIRYKAEWEEVTGYMYEPWHIRYVGKEHAARIYELDIPFEYYVAQLRAARAALAGEGAE